MGVENETNIEKVSKSSTRAPLRLYFHINSGCMDLKKIKAESHTRMNCDDAVCYLKTYSMLFQHFVEGMHSAHTTHSVTFSFAILREKKNERKLKLITV